MWIVLIIVLLVVIAICASRSDRRKATAAYEVGLLKRCTQCCSCVELEAVVCGPCGSQTFSAIDRKALIRKRQQIVAVGAVLVLVAIIWIKNTN